MTECRLDEQATNVAAPVRDAFRAVLGDRLAAIAVHGSAVTGYIERFWDFHFGVFSRGGLRHIDARALGERLGRAELGPFA